MNDKTESDQVMGNSPPPQGSRSRRSARLVFGYAALLLVAIGVLIIPGQWDLFLGEFLVCSPNTFRDFEVYRWVSSGWLPLEGPSTSIGGHHGYLAYWVIGGWHALFPGFFGLQLFGVATLLVTLWLSYRVARRVTPPLYAALGVSVFFGSPILFLIHYPNHIVLIPLATALAFYGLLRSREGVRWALLASFGIVLAIGSHRTGWLLLVAIVAADLRFHFQWFRKGVALIPVAIYLIPEVLSRFHPGALPAGSMESALSAMDPWLVLRTMPFHQFKEDAGSFLRMGELVLVLGAMAAAFMATKGQKEGRVLWWFYALNFVGYPFYRFDLQYYMPMFALLPALMALALASPLVLSRKQVALPLFGGLFAVIVLNGVAMNVQIENFQQPESKHFRSIAAELETIALLDAAGASQEEVLQCAELEPFSMREFGVFYRTFSQAPQEVDRPFKRYFFGEKSLGEESGEREVLGEVAGRSFLAEATTMPCSKGPQPISEGILYWNPSTGELKRK